VAPEPAKYGKQIRFAERRGIPYVWFPQPGGGHEVKDIRSGDQVAADPEAWTPPQADLHPSISMLSETKSGDEGL
jgi:histidyl-tRNA synthetase